MAKEARSNAVKPIPLSAAMEIAKTCQPRSKTQTPQSKINPGRMTANMSYNSNLNFEKSIGCSHSAGLPIINLAHNTRCQSNRVRDGLQPFPDTDGNRLSIFRMIRSAHWITSLNQSVRPWAPLSTTEQVICGLHMQRSQNCRHDTYNAFARFLHRRSLALSLYIRQALRRGTRNFAHRRIGRPKRRISLSPSR